MARPALYGQAMTPAERQAKKRTARLLLLQLIIDDLNEARQALAVGHPARHLIVTALEKINEL